MEIETQQSHLSYQDTQLLLLLWYFPYTSQKALKPRLFTIAIYQKVLGFYEQRNTLHVRWHYKIDVSGHFWFLLVLGNCSTSVFYIALFVETYQFLFPIAKMFLVSWDFCLYRKLVCDDFIPTKNVLL